MLTRRDLFRRLAGAVIGVSVAPTVIEAVKPALAFHPDAFKMAMAPIGDYTSAAIAAIANRIDEDCLRIYVKAAQRPPKPFVVARW